MRHSPGYVQQADLIRAVVSTAGYVSLGAAVMAGKTSDVDHALRRSQRHRAGGPRRAFAEGVKVAARPEAQLLSATVITIALHRAGAPGARAVIGAAMCAFLADRLSKAIAHRRRPPGYHERRKHESFPSGHTAATTALTFTVARVLEREGLVKPPFARLVATLLASIVGESRLALDEHWPTDVLAGVLLGSAASSFALAVDDAMRRRRY